MLAREEFLPEFVRFSNTVYRLDNGWQSPLDFESAQAQLAADLEGLKSRLAWELPLLCSFSGGAAVGHEVARLFGRLEAALQEATPHNVSSHFTAALDAFLDTMRSADSLRRELPVFTDVKIVNELLLLASAVLDGQTDKDPIAGRLPILLDWINRKEADWRTYLRLFPDQLYRVNTVLAAFDAMRQGAGGIYLYLEDGDAESLKGGLAIVLRALEVMAPAVETRFLTESERAEFSTDLRLERPWRGADWPNWEGTTLAVDLLTFYQESQRLIRSLDNKTLMPGSVYLETLDRLSQAESQLHSSFDQLWKQQVLPEDQPARPARAQALADLEAARALLQTVSERVSLSLANYQDLETIPLYANLLGILQAVLQEQTPDAYLHQLLLAMGEGRARFQEVVERVAEEQQEAEDYADPSASSQYMHQPSRGPVAGPASAAGAGLAASMASRFDLPVATQGAELFVEEVAYEVIEQGTADIPFPAADQGEVEFEEPDPEVWDEEPQDDGDPALAEGEPEEEALDPYQAAWDALQNQEQAIELLWGYLQTGERAAIYEAFELFSETFLTLSQFAEPEVGDPEPPDFTVCPYCQQSFPSDSDRCPNCKRIVSLKTRAPLQAPGQPAAIGSTLLASLDQRTLALSASSDAEPLAREWRALAKRLESMARAARNDSKSARLEPLFAELIAGCQGIAEALLGQRASYSSLRIPLLERFSRLESFVKNM